MQLNTYISYKFMVQYLNNSFWANKSFNLFPISVKPKHKTDQNTHKNLLSYLKIQTFSKTSQQNPNWTQLNKWVINKILIKKYLQLKSFKELVMFRLSPTLSGFGNRVRFSDLLTRILRWRIWRRRRRCCRERWESR